MIIKAQIKVGNGNHGVYLLDDIVVKLNQTVNAVLKLQATHAAFARLGASTMDGTPDQARKYIQGEFDKWSAVLRTIKDK